MIKIIKNYPLTEGSRYIIYGVSFEGVLNLLKPQEQISLDNRQIL